MKHLFLLTLYLNTYAAISQNPFLHPVITNLNEPIQTTHAEDNKHRVFVVEKGGTIKVFDSSYIFLDTLLRITGIRTSGEQGLLSLAFHPNFRQNGYLYIYYTANGPNNWNNNLVVDRYTVPTDNPNQNKAEVNSRKNILSIYHPATNHNGGKLNFGKDGFLYLATGDSGGGNDPANSAQDTSSLLGKLLRINIDVPNDTIKYLIPPGNLYNKAYYATGLRNPFRWTFDRYTGDIYIGDVGQSGYEEVNYLPQSQIFGANFGWKCYEGPNPYIGDNCPAANLVVSPTHYYPTSSGNNSVVGGIVYRGYKYPDLKNYYIFSDFYGGNIRLINRSGNNWTPIVYNGNYSNISDYSEKEDGEVLISRLSDGIVYELRSNTVRTVYTFSGNGDWNTSSNWKGNTIPPNPLLAGQVIVIKPFNGGACSITPNQTILSGAEIIIEP